MENTIGFYDSGVGGLNILQKTISHLGNMDFIYVADNLGYLYSYNYSINKILWAKNYKIPFRSNLKIYNKQLALADQANTLYLFNSSECTFLITLYLA